MPWQPMHMAIFLEPASALPVIFWAWAESVTQATARAHTVVNNLFILRAQSLVELQVFLINFRLYAGLHPRPGPEPPGATQRRSTVSSFNHPAFFAAPCHP